MYDYSFGFRRDPNLRASDTEREAVAERLRRHHTEGRLDAEEFQERIDRCLKAKTLGELDELVTDLPREREPRTRSMRVGKLFAYPLVPILFVLFAISLAGWHHRGLGLLWLIPVFFLVRFCLFRRFGRWGRRWRHFDEQQV
jgi:hypothetical protein